MFVLFGFATAYHLSLLPRNVLEKYIQIVFIAKQMYVYTYNKTPYRPVTKSAVHEKLLSKWNMYIWFPNSIQIVSKVVELSML